MAVSIYIRFIISKTPCYTSSINAYLLKGTLFPAVVKFCPGSRNSSDYSDLNSDMIFF
jgi:hypothetical protein